jgi:uncharacterized MAPEG superfamily protein
MYTLLNSFKRTMASIALYLALVLAGTTAQGINILVYIFIFAFLSACVYLRLVTNGESI